MSHIPQVCDVYYGFYRRYYLETTKSQRTWLYSDDSSNISPGTAVLGNIATNSRVIRQKLQDEPYPIGLRCILRFLSTLLPRNNEIAKNLVYSDDSSNITTMAGVLGNIATDSRA